MGLSFSKRNIHFKKYLTSLKDIHYEKEEKHFCLEDVREETKSSLIEWRTKQNIPSIHRSKKNTFLLKYKLRKDAILNAIAICGDPLPSLIAWRFVYEYRGKERVLCEQKNIPSPNVSILNYSFPVCFLKDGSLTFVLEVAEKNLEPLIPEILFKQNHFIEISYLFFNNHPTDFLTQNHLSFPEYHSYLEDGILYSTKQRLKKQRYYCSPNCYPSVGSLTQDSDREEEQPENQLEDNTELSNSDSEEDDVVVLSREPPKTSRTHFEHYRA